MAELTNNIPEMLIQIKRNIPETLEDLLDDSITSVRYIMKTGYSETHKHWFLSKQAHKDIYGTDIYDSGALHDDVQGYVDNEDQSYYIGNKLDYATYVHNGTRRVNERPYLYDTFVYHNIIDFEKIIKMDLMRGIRGVYDG